MGRRSDMENVLWAGSQRSSSGQAIAEGAVGLGLITVSAAFLLLFMVQTYGSTNQNYRLLQLASSAAERITAAKWWMGMQDPNFEAPKPDGSDGPSRVARDELNARLAALHMGECKNFAVTTKQIWLQKKLTTIVRVDFDVNASVPLLGVPVKLHATGLASDAEHAITSHGYALVHAVGSVHPNSPTGESGLRIPVYNCTVGHNTAAHPNWMKCGTFTGTVPTAYLRLEVPSYGQLSRRILDKTSTDPNALERTDLYPWGGAIQPGM